jgi:hypothetical protein
MFDSVDVDMGRSYLYFMVAKTECPCAPRLSEVTPSYLPSCCREGLQPAGNGKKDPVAKSKSTNLHSFSSEPSYRQIRRRPGVPQSGKESQQQAQQPLKFRVFSKITRNHIKKREKTMILLLALVANLISSSQSHSFLTCPFPYENENPFRGGNVVAPCGGTGVADAAVPFIPVNARPVSQFRVGDRVKVWFQTFKETNL